MAGRAHFFPKDSFVLKPLRGRIMDRSIEIHSDAPELYGVYRGGSCHSEHDYIERGLRAEHGDEP